MEGARAGEEAGPCCGCGRPLRHPLTVVLLEVKTKPVETPDGLRRFGWGCETCGLPPEGAFAVLCASCAAVGVEPTHAVLGDPEDKQRMPIRELLDQGPHEHDQRYHLNSISLN